jgi:hypothetical protein
MLFMRKKKTLQRKPEEIRIFGAVDFFQTLQAQNFFRLK